MNAIFLEIQDLLKDKVQQARGIKAVYDGDPTLINKSNLPAILVAPVGTELKRSSIGDCFFNKVDHRIQVMLVCDARDTFNKNPEEVGVQKYILDTIFEQDSNNDLREDTILGALTQGVTLNEEVLYTDDYSIRYGLVDSRDFLTLEAVITFRAHLEPRRPA